MKEYIEAHCGLAVLTVQPTKNGSGNTFVVSTSTGRYIAKVKERPDFLALYKKAQPFLENAGFKQSYIHYSDDELTLYEWLNGQSYKTLTHEKMENTIHYTKRYFEALKQVPVEANEIKRMNAWDDAKSLTFLLDIFPSNDLHLTIPCIATTIKHLAAHRATLYNLPKQLIHSDLGADNFLFQGDEIIAIIDFTPEIASDLYGLCHFLYWNVLWQEENPLSLHKWAIQYLPHLDHEVFDLLMKQVALYRIVGPLLNGSTNLDKRILLLKKLLDK